MALPKSINIPRYTEVNEMASTTIKLNAETKAQLDTFRQYENESYDEVIRKLIFVSRKVRKEPKLSQKTIREIEEARERMNRGEFYTHAEAMKRLGMRVRNKL